MNGIQRGGGGGGGGRGKWKTLRERLGFKGIGCCGGGGGAIWGFGASSNMRIREEDEEEDEENDLQEDHEMLGDVVGQIPVENNNNNNVERDCVGQIPVVASGVNLAMALAAERHFRAATQDWDNDEVGVGVGVVGTTDSSAAPSSTTTTTTATRMNNSSSSFSSGTAAAISNTVAGTPMRVSLMRLLEDGDVDVDEEEDEEGTTEGGGGGGGEVVQRRRIGGTTEGGNDAVCCVCMRRKKGAAFIPCGHTFCRVCSRELWLNRGSCPLCNRAILEILDIF